MHAKRVELRFEGARPLGVGRQRKKLANGRGLFFWEGLAHVQPISGQHSVQGNKLVCQFLCAAGAYGWDMQFIEQAGQACAGAELSAQLARLL